MKRTNTTESHVPSESAGKIENHQLWAVVLAGGEGTRLAAVTRRLHGRDVPKQFAALHGEQTLLQQTVARLAPRVPASRIVVVVARDRRDLAEEQLRHVKGIQIVSQPENSGTGPGVFLPLSLIKSQCPQAMVVVTPSDHHFAASSAFLAAIDEGVHASTRAPAGLALIGAEADAPATDLGWIVPGPMGPEPGAPGEVPVQAFVEKPSAAVASELLAEGGLWNTLIMVGTLASFWRQGEEHLPRQLSLFEEYIAAMERETAPSSPGAPSRATEHLLNRLYKRMPPADFSRAVLEHARGLAVVAMRASGWRDCGTPDRLLDYLDESNDRRDQVLKAILRTVAVGRTFQPLAAAHGSSA